MNPSRKTAPDIDIDIAPKIHERVLAYCKEKYGEKAVVMLSTKIRMGALQALEHAANCHKASPQLLRTMKECVKKETENLASSDDLKQFTQKNKKAAQIYADALLLEGRQIGTGQHHPDWFYQMQKTLATGSRFYLTVVLEVGKHT